MRPSYADPYLMSDRPSCASACSAVQRARSRERLVPHRSRHRPARDPDGFSRHGPCGRLARSDRVCRVAGRDAEASGAQFAHESVLQDREIMPPPCGQTIARWRWWTTRSHTIATVLDALSYNRPNEPDVRVHRVSAGSRCGTRCRHRQRRQLCFGHRAFCADPDIAP